MHYFISAKYALMSIRLDRRIERLRRVISHAFRLARQR